MLVLIPARYASSRFPGKPLCEIAGKSMIEWVFRHCSEGTPLTGQTTPKFDVAVVTDDERIETCVKGFGGQVVRVDDDVPSGTERIFLAYERYFAQEKYDLIINVQGDEPLFKNEDLAELCNYHLGSTFDVATMVKKRTDFVDFNNPDVVKVIMSESNGKCHYFSRASIPFARDRELEHWYSHVGVYSYRPQSLQSFCRAPRGHYEMTECLEQLRALEMGLTIGAMCTDKTFIGVDRPEDIKKILEKLE